MSITDYSSLQTAVANWMAQTGNTDFTGNVTDFITLCEARLNYGSDDPDFPSPPLRTAQMEIPSTTLTVVNSSNTVSLPSDFLQLRRMYLTGSPIHKLTYVTPNQMDSALATFPAGPPEFFTIMAGLIVLPSPVQTTQTLVGGYYQKIPALSTSNTVNWLLAAHPGMYLAGANLEASLFIGDDQSAAKWARVFSGHTRAFEKQDLKGRYSGDALQIKTDVGNP